ncbi:MAG TPA: glycine--tRNA ligase subunit beta [Candidatus Acidoferrales bacterium]|nr:glycine--tRNA ligase subunit beta [Candidatus Acidoferrales bacterium]
MKPPVIEEVPQTPAPDPATEPQKQRLDVEIAAEASGLAQRFLLEIGTEEIPDWMIPAALENLRLLFEKLELPHESLRLDATPRRLVLRAYGLPLRLKDREERVQGPAKTAPAQAVAGFARKLGVLPEDLVLEATAKGEYYSYKKKVPGRAVKLILAEALPGVILGIYFPKTMYWTGKGGPRFIRPIRWIVALLGEDIVPFEVAGVRSGALSAGHRRLGAREIAVTASDYEQRLRDHYVILSAEDRREKIVSQMARIRVKKDPALLETLVYLTEWPKPITGTFDPQFLQLPEEVLITVMRHHQKYFSVEDASGKLAPQFVAIMNTESDPEGFIRRGNERVLRARFNDARFFWDSDQKKKLCDRKPDLAHVTFQAKLGSYLEKAERMMRLARELGGDAHAVRAAELCKCDLTTELVKEFTELQGVVGGLYARVQGEPEPVWEAIYDHYKPESMDDALPRNRTARIVALADKLDTLRGCFGVGMIPTGSKDPFALRRAAQGVVRILVEGKFELPLFDLIGPDENLRAFFEERVKYYFKDIRGFKYDEVNACMAAGWGNLVDLEARLERVQALRPTPDFEPLAASFKRIRNILEQAKWSGPSTVDPALLEAGPEKELHDEYLRIAGQPVESTIAKLRPKIDLFFDKVLVNAPDERIRRNRLMLLHTLREEFSKVADFSEIVTHS